MLIVYGWMHGGGRAAGAGGEEAKHGVDAGLLQGHGPCLATTHGCAHAPSLIPFTAS